MNLENVRFLVVDDIPAMCQVTSNLLRALGATDIQTAPNGAEALRLLQVKPVDLILSDWNMPEMSGLQLLQAVRANEKLAEIPFVMVTAEAERERIAEAISAGVSDLLVKPYTRQRLEDKVAGALSRRVRPLGHPLPAIPTGEPPQPTLLVVDDTPENLRLLADLFEHLYKVRVAHNGQKALAMCQSDNPPDLVLLDVMMPGMDGFEVARRMREHPNSAHIPIVFVTALNDDQARRRGLGLGAVDFVTKPVDPELLQLRVNNFMRYIAVHLQRQAEYDALLENARLREDVERMLRHDIKGPLAGVLGLAQELASNKALAPEHARQAQLIADSAQQALSTVSMSSDVLRIETGSFELVPEAVDLAALLRQAGVTARAAFSAKQLDLRVETEAGAASARGDAGLCYAIFHNLLKNACEAAPQGGAVTVMLRNAKPLVVLVENDGVVPPAMRSRFFDRYATSGKREGTGLGTYSAKLLTEAQGGTIAMATDDDSQRTVLTVTLPAWV